MSAPSLSCIMMMTKYLNMLALQCSASWLTCQLFDLQQEAANHPLATATGCTHRDALTLYTCSSLSFMVMDLWDVGCQS